MRIGLIHVSQEINDFNPMPTTLDDFRSFGIYEGSEILDRLQGVGQVGGYLEVVEQGPVPIETVPIISTWSCAGGRITTEALNFRAKIRAGLERAGRLDGLALQLHGACASEGTDDIDGEPHPFPAYVEAIRRVETTIGPQEAIKAAYANLNKVLVESAFGIPTNTIDSGLIVAGKNVGGITLDIDNMLVARTIGFTG